MENSGFQLTPETAIIDNDHDAMRNLNLSLTLLYALINDIAIATGQMSEDNADALGLVEQTIESVNMYLERMNG